MTNRNPQAETQHPVKISNNFKITPGQLTFLRNLGLHRGEVVRYKQVHVNTWKALSKYVVMGLITVNREYGHATARLTPKGEIVCHGRKPGPKPGHGQKGPLIYICHYKCSEKAHWTVKLVTALCAERRVSIRMISLQSGIAEATVKNWMKRSVPTVDKIEAVLAVFDLTLATAQVEWKRRTQQENEHEQEDALIE